MKNFYQFKGMGYMLPPVIYAKTVKTIKAYDYYKAFLNSEEMSVEKKAINKVQAEHYINAIDDALKAYVKENLQEAVFLHTAKGYTYAEIETMTQLVSGMELTTETELKKWCQKFIFGVAKELGDDF